MMAVFGEIRELRDIWAELTHRAPRRAREEILQRMLFDMLGLRLEQAIRHLG